MNEKEREPLGDSGFSYNRFTKTPCISRGTPCTNNKKQEKKMSETRKDEAPAAADEVKGVKAAAIGKYLIRPDEKQDELERIEQKMNDLDARLGVYIDLFKAGKVNGKNKRTVLNRLAGIKSNTDVMIGKLTMIGSEVGQEIDWLCTGEAGKQEKLIQRLIYLQSVRNSIIISVFFMKEEAELLIAWAKGIHREPPHLKHADDN